MAVELEKGGLKSDVKKMTDSNLLLKSKYDTLHESYQHLDEVYRKEKLHGSDILEDMIHLKEQAAARMNHRNERRLRWGCVEVQLRPKVYIRLKILDLSFVHFKFKQLKAMTPYITKVYVNLCLTEDLL